MIVLAAFVEGVSVTEHEDDVEVAGDGAQVIGEKASPGTLDEKVTRPAGLDGVPAADTSATVAVTVVGARTVAGFGERLTVVVVARRFTVRMTAGDDDEVAWMLVAGNVAVSG